jgi:hypothetical protein
VGHGRLSWVVPAPEGPGPLYWLAQRNYQRPIVGYDSIDIVTSLAALMAATK